MPKIAVEMPVALSPAQCRRFVLDSLDDAALHQAYEKLRGLKKMLEVRHDTPDRLVFFEPAYDTRYAHHAEQNIGWTITYEFIPAEPDRTLVGLIIEYNRKTDRLGGGLMKSQAENEVLHRLHALMAYERGWAEGQTAPATD